MTLSSPFPPYCGRLGHPGPYIHECLPQCPSTSPRTKERCDKDDGHTDFHWTLRDGSIDVWDAMRGLDSDPSQTSANVDAVPEERAPEVSALRVNDTVSEGAWCECPGTTRRHFRTPACPVSADRHPDDPARSPHRRPCRLAVVGADSCQQRPDPEHLAPTRMGRAVADTFHARARDLGLCAVIAADRTRVCNHPVGHVGVHSQTDNGWNLCRCGHAVVEHEASRQLCCICICRAFVTPSRTDRQPPASASVTKGGQGADERASR